MNPKIQKKLAGKIARRSPKRVRLDPARMDEIKEAITRADVKTLIKNGAIRLVNDKGVSRGRAKQIKAQKSKGRKRGQGSRKGKENARFNTKKKWMNKVRLQRTFLKELKDRKLIVQEVYKDLYNKSKGGFFRSKRHIQLYLTEHKLVRS